MFHSNTDSLTFQELQLGLLSVDADGIEALGGSHAALHMVSSEGVQNAALPGPVQAQHQYLLAVSSALQTEGQHTQPGGRGWCEKEAQQGGWKGQPSQGHLSQGGWCRRSSRPSRR